MLDALLFARPMARAKSNVLRRLELQPQKYSLVTIHRPANTDDPTRLSTILSALNQTGETIILPMHPRTRKVLESLEVRLNDTLRIIDPVGYFDMITLEENARLIATDSGGVQREAYYWAFRVSPCGMRQSGWGRWKPVGTNWSVLTGK